MALKGLRAALEKFGGDSLAAQHRRLLSAASPTAKHRPRGPGYQMAPVRVRRPAGPGTTIGRWLLRRGHLLDTDVATTATGRSIADIFATDGSRSSGRIEEDVVRVALADHDGALFGGGAVTRPGAHGAGRPHRRLPEIAPPGGRCRTGGNTVRPLLAGLTAPKIPRALIAGTAVPARRDHASGHHRRNLGGGPP